MQEVSCKTCLQVSRVEYIGADIGGTIPKHCAYCGSSEIVFKKVDSYWHDLAEELGFQRSSKDAEFIQSLYRLWEPAVDGKFRDFVKGAMNAVST